MCHLLIAGHKHVAMGKGRGELIWESQCEKLLGLRIDSELSFNAHITNIAIRQAHCTEKVL